MNDQRPTAWPRSADSSRKAGSSPRSFRKAETGVSQSSTKVWRTGTSACSRASARASSSEGVTFGAAPGSAATAKEHLLGVPEPQPARREQHEQVVQHVGGLLGHALVGLLSRRAGDLLGFLLDLLADVRRVGQELRGVRALLRVGPALGQRALEAGQRLVERGRLEVSLVEAGPRPGVAGGAGRLDEREHGVAVAVEPQRPDGLRVAARRALVPQLLPRAAPEMQLAGALRGLDGLGVLVGEGEDLARAPVLDDARDEPTLVEGDGGGVHGSARFYVWHVVGR